MLIVISSVMIKKEKMYENCYPLPGKGGSSMKKLRSNRLSAVLAAVSVCSCVTAAVMLRPLDSSGISISNDYLVLQVQDNPGDPGYGAYQLFKNTGSTQEALTYTQFYSSFAQISINGNVCLFSEGETVSELNNVDNKSIVTVKDFDGVEITQTLSFSTGNTTNNDMLKIEYYAVNNNDDNVLVSVRAVIDPTIADSESDSIIVDKAEYSEETSFYDGSIPTDWSIRDKSGKITAYGIVSDSGAKPDCFDIADWKNLYNSRFDYSPAEKISDNAAAVTWNDRTLKSGETLVCSTKYGLYSEKPVNGNPPKTGDTAGYVFAGIGLCSMTAAILTRKRRSDDNE